MQASIARTALPTRPQLARSVRRISTLLQAPPALAEGVEEAATEALAAAPANAVALGWGLAVSPIIFYTGFSLYRSQIDPRAKFGDAVFAFAAFIILANIISITVFKFRIY